MNSRLSLTILLISGLILPGLSFYAWQAPSGEYSVEAAREVALYFLKNGPTFRFDGITESIEILEIEIRESYPIQYVVTIEFDSRHAGYGDRTGLVLAQVITPHTIVVTVVEGHVIWAIIDDRWDELNQREVVQSEILPAEYAKDLAIEYIFEKHPELGEIYEPDSWVFKDLTPEDLIGFTIQQFMGDDWTVNVSYPVIWKPTYGVEIMHIGEVYFYWRGEVDQTGAVEELEYSTSAHS